MLGIDVANAWNGRMGKWSTNGPLGAKKLAVSVKGEETFSHP